MAASAGLIGETAAFYGERLGLGLVQGEECGVEVRVGESVLAFRASPGSPFYHVALLVPGDRFDAALDWARERVELLPDPESRATPSSTSRTGRRGRATSTTRAAASSS